MAANPVHHACPLREEDIFWARGVLRNRGLDTFNTIVTQGYVTSEEIRQQQDRTDAASAIRDIRQKGIGIHDEWAKSGGKRVKRYVFSGVVNREVISRKHIPQSIQRAVRARGYCELCGDTRPTKDLQVDHRIPIGVGGELLSPTVEDFMAVCASCNRKKSSICERCSNWARKHVSDCQRCSLFNPLDHTHTAMRLNNRVSVNLDVGAPGFRDEVEKAAAAEGTTPERFLSGSAAREMGRALNHPPVPRIDLA